MTPAAWFRTASTPERVAVAVAVALVAATALLRGRTPPPAAPPADDWPDPPLTLDPYALDPYTMMANDRTTYDALTAVQRSTDAQEAAARRLRGRVTGLAERGSAVDARQTASIRSLRERVADLSRRLRRLEGTDRAPENEGNDAITIDPGSLVGYTSNLAAGEGYDAITIDPGRLPVGA